MLVYICMSYLYEMRLSQEVLEMSSCISMYTWLVAVVSKNMGPIIRRCDNALTLSVSREERCEVLACFHIVVKMYRYSLEERVFFVKTYWITGSIKNCQRRFVEQFGGRIAAFNF
jgi:hypothetical protein